MSLRDVTILIADDNAPMAEALRLFFEEQGVKVMGPATDIEAALSLLGVSKPDCAILNAGIAYETAMRVTKKLNGLGVPYLILSDEADAAPQAPHQDIRHLSRSIDRTHLRDAVAVMVAK